MRLDLRARFAVLVAVSAMVMVINDPRWNLVVLAGLLGLALWLRLPLRGLLGVLRGLLVVIVLVGVAAALTTGDRGFTDPAMGATLWQAGPLRVTLGGVATGANFALRMMAMVLVSWLCIAGIALDDVLELAAHWNWPAWLSILLSTAMAAIPNLIVRREQIMTAQQARGLRLEGRNPVKRWAASAAIMIPLVTSSLVSAENLAVALSVRGYGAHRTMTVLGRLVWRPRDAIIAVLALLLGVAVVVARIAWGFGRL